MRKDEKVVLLDFLQGNDGVKSGQVTNCLLGTEETKELETVTVVVKAPGHLVKEPGVLYVRSDVYADYCEYVKRMVFFEQLEGETLSCIHSDGPWN